MSAAMNVQIDQNASKSESTPLWSGFESWSHLFRFLIAVVVVVGIAYLAVQRTVATLYDTPGLEITFSQGATVVRRHNELERAQVLLPASVMWMDTQVDVKPGERLHVRAFGRIQLALDRLVDAARRDAPLEYTWIGPEGDSASVRLPGDAPRDKFLIEPGATYGKLLGYLQCGNAEAPSKTNPRPAGINAIGNDGTVENRAEDTCCRLWVVVNDTFLDSSDEAKSKYLMTEQLLRDRYGKLPDKDTGKAEFVTVSAQNAKWQQIVERGYWDLWFDDNIGNFFIDIRPDRGGRNTGASHCS